jgi:hypothetical protein
MQPEIEPIARTQGGYDCADELVGISNNGSSSTVNRR